MHYPSFFLGMAVGVIGVLGVEAYLDWRDRKAELADYKGEQIESSSGYYIYGNGASDQSQTPLEGHRIDSNELFSPIGYESAGVVYKATEDHISHSDEEDEQPAEMPKDAIPYPEGCREVEEEEYARLCCDDDVESYELVYYRGDDRWSEEGDIFNQLGVLEIEQMIGKQFVDYITRGTVSENEYVHERHIFDDHKQTLYTITIYEGSWEDIAAYADGR